MTTANFQALRAAVLASSSADEWATAVHEWEVVEVDEDPALRGVCVCGQTGLHYLFTIRNHRNSATLHPIGSSCVNHFGRADLDREVDVLPKLFKILTASVNGQRITLTSEFFSRVVLEYLYDGGAFTPDQYNNADGASDYEFLLKMFNKKKKEDITSPQQRKISVLLNTKVIAFIVNDYRLKHGQPAK
jgi:hypothetical protein